MTQENKSDKPGRIVIQSKAYGPKWETIFFQDIQNAFDAGYKIADTGLRADASMRNYRGRIGRVVMYLKGHEPKMFSPVESTVVEVENTLKEESKDVSTGAPENTPVKEKEVVDEKKTTPLKQLEDISDYQGLKAFAADNGIDMPNKVYNPKAVKKYLKEKLKA